MALEKPQDDAGHTAITQGRDDRCPTGVTALPGPHQVGTPLTTVSSEDICVGTQGKAVEAEPLMGDAFALFDFLASVSQLLKGELCSAQHVEHNNKPPSLWHHYVED